MKNCEVKAPILGVSTSKWQVGRTDNNKMARRSVDLAMNGRSHEHADYLKGCCAVEHRAKFLATRRQASVRGTAGRAVH